MGGRVLTPNDLQPNLEVNEFNMVVNVNGNQLPLALAKLLVANETANSLTRIADALERAYPPPADYVKPGTPPEEKTDG